MNGVETMKKSNVGRLVGFMLVGLFLVVSSGSGLAANDQESLQGLTAAKVVFDVKKDDPEKLLRALAAIRNVSNSLVRQGVQPDMIVSFRGPTVVCLAEMKEDPEMDEYQEDVLDKISWNIIELKKAGVQLEVCELALKLVGMENTGLQPGIKKVENSLISLIAHQNKGYAMVAI
jgi:intracellular sulfur oxidation DsrE/DsrF family protein